MTHSGVASATVNYWLPAIQGVMASRCRWGNHAGLHHAVFVSVELPENLGGKIISSLQLTTHPQHGPLAQLLRGNRLVENQQIDDVSQLTLVDGPVSINVPDVKHRVCIQLALHRKVQG